MCGSYSVLGYTLLFYAYNLALYLNYIGFFFLVYLRMALIFTDFPTEKWVLSMCTVGNLRISGTSLS